MAVLTGATGELRYCNQRVGKCRNFSLDIARDSLETTALGDWDRTYVEGIRGATGSATVLYDPDDFGAIQFLNSIFMDNIPENGSSVEFYVNTSLNKVFAASAIVTQVSTPVSTGDVVACSINFQISGPISGIF